MWKRVTLAWKDLSRSIYKGKRLRDNLRALTTVSLFTVLLGATLIVLDLITGATSMLIPSLITFLGGASCAYISGIVKKREIAIWIPTAFCIIAFTYYAFTGAAGGTAVLWSLLLPIGISYFVSVKVGILLSVYYTLLYTILFYTPLRNYVTAYYTEEFLERFPLIYGSMSVFTAIAMIQYHRSVLLEQEYTERLNAEVARQTAVAEERSRRIEQMSFQTIQTLAYAIDAKDPYTKGHSTRVSAYSVRVAQALGWDKDRVNDLKYAALLHDIGKIGVPDSILNNPKRLSDVEYEIIKSHTTMGRDILKDRVLIPGADKVALCHHERYDGKGYPKGLRGEEIPIEARIVAVADSFDAMNSNRIYRKACDRAYVYRELMDGRSRQFDPEIVEKFVDLWDQGLLDDILKEDNVEDEGRTEFSSALLQEVMETFASQSTADDIDITTGIMGRNTGEATIAQEMMGAKGCYIFFDLDNLKKINDTSGHEAGDRALHLIGEVLSENSKEGLCCRLGGDEFILFAKRATEEQAEKLVKKILAEFEERKSEDLAVSVASLSAGLVMCEPGEPYEDVYNKADKALYRIKQNGKNGYAFYSEDMESLVNERLDAEKMVHAIRNSGSYEGALDVEFRQFTKLYEFIGKMEKRFSHQFKLILISLDPPEGTDVNEEELEKAMYYMEQSILQTIRDVDVLTQYNRQQFLVILLGAEPEGVRIAVDRIFRGYYKMHGSGGFSPSYSVVERK